MFAVAPWANSPLRPFARFPESQTDEPEELLAELAAIRLAAHDEILAGFDTQGLPRTGVCSACSQQARKGVYVIFSAGTCLCCLICRRPAARGFGGSCGQHRSAEDAGLIRKQSKAS
ncbi:hypothetical protein A9D60_16710 [Leisingera sp. JC1]|nr:hypothetical protein A9D60_16710 [Leisingera sp. JC1]